ncbi:hypothetical protein [uncultured Maricaulis sp.]|tara:strand:- start:99329 stop:99478 length:150 start_codon:yes stop_codon:yes gene_type:complete
MMEAPMRWAGLIFSAVILATTLWFVVAAPRSSGDQLVLAAASWVSSDTV